MLEATGTIGFRSRRATLELNFDHCRRPSEKWRPMIDSQIVLLKILPDYSFFFLLTVLYGKAVIEDIFSLINGL